MTEEILDKLFGPVAEDEEYVAVVVDPMHRRYGETALLAHANNGLRGVYVRYKDQEEIEFLENGMYNDVTLPQFSLVG